MTVCVCVCVPVSLAGFHDAGVVLVLHVVEQDLLEPDITKWKH